MNENADTVLIVMELTPSSGILTTSVVIRVQNVTGGTATGRSTACNIHCVALDVSTAMLHGWIPNAPMLLHFRDYINMRHALTENGSEIVLIILMMQRHEKMITMTTTIGKIWDL